MESIDKDLRSKLLPAALVIKKYVKGDLQCNYEIYLREVLNSSQYFMELSNWERYEAPPHEAHGECDAITKKYRIDFKLIESTSYLEAVRQYSYSIQKLAEGIVATSRPSRIGGTYATRLHCALRNINSYEKIDEILNRQYRYIKMDKRTLQEMEMQLNADLQNFYDNLVINKNLLLFIPEIFYFEKEHYERAKAVEIIRQALTIDFSFSCQYRNHLELGKNTFICCIYDNFFWIFKFEGNEFLIVDRISVKESRTFVELNTKYNI